eukprot:SAG11_NODE_25400_length_359_cov_0.869231_2_plen_49_part_01
MVLTSHAASLRRLADLHRLEQTVALLGSGERGGNRCWMAANCEEVGESH